MHFILIRKDGSIDEVHLTPMTSSDEKTLKAAVRESNSIVLRSPSRSGQTDRRGPGRRHTDAGNS